MFWETKNHTTAYFVYIHIYLIFYIYLRSMYAIVCYFQRQSFNYHNFKKSMIRTGKLLRFDIFCFLKQHHMKAPLGSLKRLSLKIPGNRGAFPFILLNN